MNRKELEKLIDGEVTRLFDSMNMREPQPEEIQGETVEQQQPVKNRANLSKEELDDIIFYGGEKPKYM